MKKFNYIYLITNKLNGKIYIGQHTTNDINDNYLGSGIHIKRAITKYGKENFTKDILAFSDNKESLNFLEKFYIKKYKAQNQEIGYNIAFGGVFGYTYKRTPETIAKFKLTLEKRYNSYRGENNPNYGKHRPHTDETKKRISESTSGEKNGMYGKQQSDYVKLRVSEHNKNTHRVYDNPEHTKWHMEKN